MKRFIRRKEFAEILNVSVSTLDRMRQNNPFFPKTSDIFQGRLIWDVKDPEVAKYIDPKF